MVTVEQRREVLDEHENEFFSELEERWHKSLPRLSEVEWLGVFPETQPIIPVKIAEWREEKNRLINIVKQTLRRCPEDKYWETRIVLEVEVIPRIVEAGKHIARLSPLTQSHSSSSTTGRVTDFAIQQAKAVPIESLIQTKTRRSGKTLIAKCPFHEDRNPSFTIYLESNTCWCFGCQEGGDSITVIQKLNGASFAEAVHYLTNTL